MNKEDELMESITEEKVDGDVEMTKNGEEENNERTDSDAKLADNKVSEIIAKLKDKNFSKKKILVAAAIVILIMFAVNLSMTKITTDKVTGSTWGAGPVFLEAYSRDCYQMLMFSTSDDVITSLFTESGSIISFDNGTWEVSGTEIRIKIENTAGTFVYKYHPSSDTLTNGVWVYSKVE